MTRKIKELNNFRGLNILAPELPWINRKGYVMRRIIKSGPKQTNKNTQPQNEVNVEGEKIELKNVINLQEHERSTPTQEKLLFATLKLLRRKNFQGIVYYNCLVPAKKANGKIILRRPDIYIPTLGLIIEDDGSAHDNCNNRIHRDLTREEYGKILRSHVIRFDSQDIEDSISFFKVMRTIEMLVDEFMANPNLHEEGRRRRVGLCRARKKLIKENPHIKHERSKFNKHTSHREPFLYAYKVWLGRAYVFDQSSYRIERKPSKIASRPRSNEKKGPLQFLLSKIGLK